MHVEAFPGVPQEILQAWHFAMKYTRHYHELPLADRFRYDPYVLLNGLGYDICSGRGNLLARIWQAMDYPVHAVALGGHMVPEVYYNDSWHMFDPTFGLFLFDKDSTVAGLKQLEDRAAYFEQEVRNYHSFQTFILLDSSYYRSLFTSSRNNRVEAIEDRMAKEAAFFTMPPDAQIEFPVAPECPLPAIPYTFARLTLPDYSGSMQLPFPLYGIAGNGALMSPKGIILTENTPWRCFAPGNYQVLRSPLTLYFYINPLLLQMQTQNRLHVVTDSKTAPELCLGKQSAYIPVPAMDLVNEEQVRQIYNTYAQANNKRLADHIHIDKFEDYRQTAESFFKMHYNTSQIPDSIHEKIQFFHTLISESTDSPTQLFLFMNNRTYLQAILIITLEFPGEVLQQILTENKYYLQ